MLDSSDADLAKTIASTLAKKDWGGIPEAKVALVARAYGIDPTTLDRKTPAGQVEVGKFLSKLDRSLSGDKLPSKRHLLDVFFGEGE